MFTFLSTLKNQEYFTSNFYLFPLAPKELIEQLNQLPKEKLELAEELIKELLEESIPEKRAGLFSAWLRANLTCWMAGRIQFLDFKSLTIN